MNFGQTLRLRRAALPLLLGLAMGGLLLFMAIGLQPTAYALDCTVGSGKQFSTIQAAINDNSCDTIIIDAGTYNENLDISRSVTLQSAGSSKPVIDGGDNGRVVTIDGSVMVTLNNLHVTNGDATGESPNARTGGGILVTGGATLHAIDLQVDNNIASTAAQTGFGGGIAIGGGAADVGTAYITDTLVTDNYANRRSGDFDGGGQGGGIYVNGDAYLSLYSSSINNNTAAFRGNSFAAGGGLFQNGDSIVELKQNSWDGNVARGADSDPCSGCSATDGSGDGGAIAVQVATSTAQLTVDGDSMTNNVAHASNEDFDTNEKAGGGAISLMATNTAGQITATVRNAYISGNVAKGGTGATPSNAEGRGGAIHVRLASLSVYASTILDNEAAVSGTGSGGGIYIREPEEGDSLEVINTILAGNMASGTGQGAQIYANYSSVSGNDLIIAHSTLADDTLNNYDALFYNAPSANDFMFILNSIFTNHDAGIQNVNATGQARARYILFYNNNDDHPSPGTTAFPGDDDTTWLNGNPLFKDPANGDYHIQPGSPAIDAGGDPQDTTNGIGRDVATDVDGDDRPLENGYDIGADELKIYDLYLPMLIRN